MRDGGAPSPTDEVLRVDVVIVGGGVSGLSAAWRLRGLGLSVEVLELESFLGGTSTWGEEGVVPHPWGAHYLPVPNLEARATVRFLSEVGVLTGWDAAGRPLFDRRTLCNAPDDRLYYRGQWHMGLVPHSALEEEEEAELGRFLETVEAMTDRRGKDGRYYFQIPVQESSQDPEALALDDITMEAWLDQNGFHSEFVRWFVKYATLDDFGADPGDVSAWAGLHYFAARKVRSPELEGSHYLVWPEGNGRLVHELSERCGARLRRDAVALRVIPTRNGVEVHYLDTTKNQTRAIQARGAVLAVPGFIAQRLTSGAQRSPIVRKSSPWVVANLHVRRPIDPNQCWDNVIYQAVGLGYVDASHQLTPPREETVLTYFRAYGAEDVAATRHALIDKPWERLAAEVFTDLLPAHPDLSARTTRMDLVVWGHGMPRPTPGFLRHTLLSPVPMLDERIAWGHVDQPGMALFEEAQRAGVLAAENVARAIQADAGQTWT